MAVVDRSLEVGNGHTGFLLIHGLGGTPIELKFVAKGLARHGFRAYCCQLAGHCGNEQDLTSTSWHDWYASVEQAFDKLKQDCDTVVVGGLSMGAVLGLHLAARRSGEVGGLVLFAPTLWYDGWSLPWYRFMLRFGLMTAFGRWIIRTFYRFTEKEPYGIKDPAIRAVVVAAMSSGDTTQAGILVTPGKCVTELHDLVQAVKPELPAITTPALIVQAREDDLSSLRNCEYLQRHLGGIVNTLVLDDSYHIVTVDRQRDLVIESAAAFAALLVERLHLAEQGDQTVRALSEAQKAAARSRAALSASGKSQQ
jgi:carboxylesterase